MTEYPCHFCTGVDELGKTGEITVCFNCYLNLANQDPVTIKKTYDFSMQVHDIEHRCDECTHLFAEVK